MVRRPHTMALASPGMNSLELSMRAPQHRICDSSPPGGRDAGHASPSLAVSINLYFFLLTLALSLLQIGKGSQIGGGGCRRLA